MRERQTDRQTEKPHSTNTCVLYVSNSIKKVTLLSQTETNHDRGTIQIYKMRIVCVLGSLIPLT